MSHPSLNETAPQACLPFAVLTKYISSLRQMPDRLTHPGTPLDLSAYVTHSGNPLNWRDNINFNDDRDFISGGFGDVRKERIVIGSDTFFVAVKRIRLRNVSKARMNIRVRREVRVWEGLRHENIVQLLGTIGHDGCVGMVSQWMTTGDLYSFICPNIPMSRRLEIACDSARGLTYLHSKGVVHGDLTCKNILIDDQGKACITDFGLSILKAEFEGTHYMTSTVGGAFRYRAPELLPSDEKEVINFKPVLTSACDVWSLASVILQTLTGVVPYDNVSKDVSVLWLVMRAIRPRRPQVKELTNEYWDYINTMWGQPGVPISRPRAEQVYRSLLIFRDTAYIRRP
ncbi:kinase-like protein [Athelia psychrophila]|uniref:Kinase-like protein n=1 Tax=Athelia psychrophila TaxID=1759441 RepID=A0A166TAZ7_9AGAM|nr:kinase-like protein [Fibularhizoctonia sp. CBS 109695]